MNNELISKISEYLSLALFLKSNDSRKIFNRANQLAFELQMILPNDQIKILADTITNKMYPSECIAKFRELYGNVEPLNKERFMAHYPNARKDT